MLWRFSFSRLNIFDETSKRKYDKHFTSFGDARFAVATGGMFDIKVNSSLLFFGE
jgi:hypothetical protein